MGVINQRRVKGREEKGKRVKNKEEKICLLVK